MYQYESAEDMAATGYESDATPTTDYGPFSEGDTVKNKRTGKVLRVTEDGTWSAEYYDLVQPTGRPRPAPIAAMIGDVLSAAGYSNSGPLGEGDETHIVVAPLGISNEDEPSVWIRIAHGA